MKKVNGYFKKKKEEKPDLLGDIVQVHKLVEDLKATKTTLDEKIQESESVSRETKDTMATGMSRLEATLQEFENAAVSMIKDIRSLPHIQGNPGKDAIPPDEQKLIDIIVAKTKVDEKALANRVISMIPENKPSLKILRETFTTDPMTVIEKILSLEPEKFQLKTAHISGLDQTIRALQHQLGTKGGYIHGGGFNNIYSSSTLVSNGLTGLNFTGSGVNSVTKDAVTGIITVDISGCSGNETLAQTLALGNVTGGNDIVVSTGDQIKGQTDLFLSDSTGNNYYYASAAYIFQQWDGGGGNTDFLLQGGGTQLFSHLAIDIQTDTGLYGFSSGLAASKTGTFDFTGLTNNRTYTWPDKSGTVAMTSDITSITLQTNGTPNGSQTLLNLVNGTGITIVDDGMGNVTITATGGSTPALTANQIAYGDAANLMTSDANFTRDATTFEIAMIYPATGGNLEIKNGATLGSDMISFKQNDANNPITFGLGNTGGLGGGADSVFLIMQDVAGTESSDWYMDSGDWEISLTDGTTTSGMQSTFLYASMNHFTGTVSYRFQTDETGFTFADSNSIAKGILYFGGITLTDKTYTFQDASGTLAFLTDIPVVTGFATKALDNLASVAINTALLPDTAGTLDFGSTTLPWKDIWFSGASSTPATNQFKLTGTSTSGVRTVTFPDASGTVAYTSDLSIYELLSNKATDFSIINNTLYPTVQAVNNAIITAVTGLLDYRGSYDASTNLFPATGGSGLLGAILKGDFWICSVGGTLGGTAITPGDLIIALIDTPGQTASNWDLISHDLGYVPANVALSNLSSVAVNTTLVSDTDNTDDLGTSSIFWRTGYFKTSIELGATDTTLTRAGAGDINVEGNRVFRAGGADVPVADGGTGLSAIAGLSILVANSANTYVALTPGAGQSIRINAGNTAWEAYTPASGGGITIGTTTITSGTNTRILYNNSGVVGEYTLAGSGTVVAMATAPTFVTSITTPAVLATANDSGAIGASGTAFSDLFLASGAVINFAAGDATITHSSALLTSNVNIAVPDEAYGSGWNGSVNVPTKNAVYDKVETLALALIARNGTTTHDATNTTANTIAHGLGRTPVYVLVTATSPTLVGWAQATYVNSTQVGMSSFAPVSAGEIINSLSFDIYTTIGANDRSITGAITVDSTNITLNWTRNNTPGGTFNIAWTAFA
jgi:hypothetical protein